MTAEQLATVADESEERRPLPEGWRWVRLGDIGHFESGGTPSKENAKYWGGHIPFVTGADITEIRISAKNARTFLTEEGLYSGKTAICNTGTVLFVTRTRVGRIGIATEVMGASQDLSPYICGAEVLPEYVCRYLSSISDQLVASCRGAIIKGLTREYIYSLKIPLPPLEEQRRIATVLDEQMKAVEQARRAAEEQLEAAKLLLGAFLRSVFESEEAQNWQRKKLGEVCTFIRGPFGGSLKKEIFQKSGYLVYEQHHAIYKDFDFGRYFIDAQKFEEMRRFEVSEGDILISCSGTMGKIATVPANFRKGIINQALLKLTIVNKEVVSTKYLASILESPQIQSMYFSNQSGSAIQNVASVSDLKAIEIPLPSTKEEQETIAVRLNARARQVEQLRKSLTEQLEAIEKMPAALLRKAFAGEV